MLRKKTVSAIEQVMDELEDLELSSPGADHFPEPGESESPSINPPFSNNKPEDSVIAFTPHHIEQESLPQSSLSQSPKSQTKSPSKQSSVSGKKTSAESALKEAQKQALSPKGPVPIHISLNQSENLRLAQERIMFLDEEVERLRRENEKLISSGDILQERLDRALAQNENLKRTCEENREDFSGEKRTLLDIRDEQNKAIEKLKSENKNLENRLSNNIQQIRVRERELENRLELMKLDGQTLIREKDRYILDLKRQLDRNKNDLGKNKHKYNILKKDLDDSKDRFRRVIRGLNATLHLLRGENALDESQDDPSD